MFTQRGFEEFLLGFFALEIVFKSVAFTFDLGNGFGDSKFFGRFGSFELGFELGDFTIFFADGGSGTTFKIGNFGVFGTEVIFKIIFSLYCGKLFGTGNATG